jgi:hypothetical protein
MPVASQSEWRRMNPNAWSLASGNGSAWSRWVQISSFRISFAGKSSVRLYFLIAGFRRGAEVGSTTLSPWERAKTQSLRLLPEKGQKLKT